MLHFLLQLELAFDPTVSIIGMNQQKSIDCHKRNQRRKKIENVRKVVRGRNAT